MPPIVAWINHLLVFFLIPLLGIAICAHGFAHKFIFVPYDWGGMKGLASIQALQRDKTKTVFFTKFWATSASLLLSYSQRSAKRHNIRTLTSKNYTCCTFWGFWEWLLVTGSSHRVADVECSIAYKKGSYF